MKTKKIVSLILAMVMVLSFSSVFVSATDECYLSNAISQTITGAPKMNGTVSVDEYGDPIIVTSQAHADENNQITWTEMSSPEDEDQRAKIYMTYDQDYLYIAATLDRAQENHCTDDVGGGYQPHLAVTASQKMGNGVFLYNDKELYLFSRLAYNGNVSNSTQDYVSYKYTASASWVLDGKEGSDYYVKYDSKTSTYNYEMRIAWKNVPGMGSDTYNGSTVAMTLELADGCADESSSPSYYQIGGTAAQEGNYNSNNPHKDNVLTIVPAGQFRVSNSVAPMPSAAPTVDGKVDGNEYGAPVIITNQKHAAMTTEKDQISWTQNKTPASKDQQVKVYITNDNTYLYIAATLDNATENKRTTGGGGYHPHLAVTLSKNVDNGVFKNEKGDEIYWLYRTAYKGTGNGPVQDFYSARFIADKSVEVENGKFKNQEKYPVFDTNNTNANPDENTKSYFVSYKDNTYTFEMRIKLADAPGLKDDNGDYNGADIAMTLEVADAGTDGKDGGYYTIGGDASHQGNFNETKNPHDKKVMKFTCNPPVVAKIGNANYLTIDEAVKAAQPNDTITLQKKASDDTITVPDGVTLDLNGCVLTAEKVTCFGSIIDSIEGTGGIKIAKNVIDEAPEKTVRTVILNENNPQLPLYDEEFEGYRFFNCTIGHRKRWEDPNMKFKFGYVLTMSNAAFELLKDSDNNDELDADVKLVYTISLKVDDDEAVSMPYEFSTNLMTKAASNNSPTVSVTGFEEVGEHAIVLTSSNPKIESSTGVVIAANPSVLTLDYPTVQ